MATMRHIAHRIKGIKNIQHITKAMKMVAAARLKRAQSRLDSARPYAQKMADVTMDLAMLSAGEGHTLLKRKAEPAHPLIVLFTGDRGLCGGFHERVIDRGTALAKELSGANGAKPGFYVVGRQGARIMRRMRLAVDKTYPEATRGVTYTAAKALADALIGLYKQGLYDGIYLVFSRFQSALVQKPRVFQLLPIAASLAKKQAPKGCFIFESSAEKLLDGMLNGYVASEVFRAFLECETGELGARMSAMTNATDNAGEMISRLVLDYNRARQAQITRELSEIMGGAEALKSE